MDGSEAKRRHDLFGDALTMSVNKNLSDVTTLLAWAHDAEDAKEKLRHVEHVIALLQDVAEQLRDMDERPVMF